MPRVPPQRRRTVPGGRASKAPSRWGWWLTIALLLGGGLWAWSERDVLRGLLPDTQLNELLARADGAFEAGRLSGSDGQSARELYSAARALSPDNERALSGLEKVGQAEFERARASFEAGRLDEAEKALEQARALLGGGSELDRLAGEIDTTRARGTQLDSLLERARQAHADGHLDGAGGAVALYRQMLVADPGNAVARHELDGLGAELATGIRKALAADDLADADARLAQLADVLPDFAALPGLRADVGKARAQADARRDELLQQADAALAAGRLDGDGEDNALARYRAVLARETDNVAAHDGLRRVAAALLQRADAAIAAGHFDHAGRDLATATGLAPDSVELADARARLKAAQDKSATEARQTASSNTAPEAGNAPVPVSDADRAKAQALITRAQAAASAGDLMLPPGDCAYDLYRSALSADPDNADALAGLATLPSVARRLFDQAIAVDELDRAADFMATFSELAPGSAALPELRTKLAGAWLDQADQRADGGDLGQARHALEKARALAPDDSRIDALSQRLGG